MQSHHPAPLWYPAMATPQPLRGANYLSWFGNGTPAFFSPGSPSAGHTTMQQLSAGGDATGSVYSTPSYPYTLSVMTFPPAPAESLHSARVPSDISRPAGVAAAQALPPYPTMAIQQHPTAAPASHSHPVSGEPLNLPAQRQVSSTRMSTPPSQDESSEMPKSTEKKMHPCWMCHKSFDR